MSLRNSSAARVMRPLAVVVVVLLEMLAASTGALAMDSSNASQKHVVVTTTQSGGGQSGASITVGLGVPVTDQATLTKVKGQGTTSKMKKMTASPWHYRTTRRARVTRKMRHRARKGMRTATTKTERSPTRSLPTAVARPAS